MSQAAQARRLRVLHISPGLGVRGGVSRVVKNYLGSPLAEGCRLLHVASHADGSSATKLVVAAAGLVRTLGILVSGGVDLVHLHCGDAPSPCRKYLFQTLARLFGVRTIVHWHAALFMDQFPALPAFRRAMVRALLTRADRVVCLSTQWEHRVRRFAPEARIVVVPNAVPLPVEPAQGAPEGAPLCFTFLGSLDRRKGVLDLLEAFAPLVRNGGDVRLSICGAGDERALRQAIATLGLDNAVRFHGWVTGVAKAEILDGTDVLVLPSHGEGMPMSLLEAMALGIAVVATGVGGVPDLVEDGVNGLLVPVGDPVALTVALERLVADPVLRRQLGRCARSVVGERFSMGASVERVAEVYRDVCGEGKS